MPATIYCDEAGFTGNNLLDTQQPYFSYASVAIDPDQQRRSGRSVRKRRNPAALCKCKRDNDFSTDGVGFEPTVRYERTHTFQACALNHSATRPYILFRREQSAFRTR